MKKIIALLILPLLVSCGVCKKKPTVVYRDSIRVEYRDRVVRDTVSFTIEKEVEKVVTRDTISHLENTYAKSDAIVSDGFLSHSLESKPKIVSVPVEVRVTDTLYVEKQAEIRTEYVEVEKSLTWWQSFRLKTFGFFALLSILFGVWIFRRPLIALIKKFF